MQENLKRKVISIFRRLIEQKSVEEQLVSLIKDTDKATQNIENLPNPYFHHNVPNDANERDDVIFISSRFRTGSTLLWNLFRQLDNCTSYYEPFNERRWFDSDIRGESVDTSHRGVNDYWAEYEGFSELTSLYDENWIRRNLQMDSSSFNKDMRLFINKLIDKAPGRPVLQFNRIDFRLPWIKHNYPNAKILHLYRNPRDQWLSFLTDLKAMNKDDVLTTYKDAFYLDLWCDDLYKHYPFLNKKITPHPYQRFYYIWKLSFLHGKKYSDMSISFEELTANTASVLVQIMETVKLNNVPIEKLCDIISAPKVDKWKEYADEEWFTEHETKCEKELNSFLMARADPVT